MTIQNEKRFWHIIYAYIPIALIGIFFFGSIITYSYYTLIFLGVIPFFFLFLNKKIERGDVKSSFLYSLPILWPFMVDFIYGLYNYGSDVLSHWQWHVAPSTLPLLDFFDKYFLHPFIIFSFSWNLFFLCVVQTALQKQVRPGWAIIATTCIWTLWYFSLSMVLKGGSWSILGHFSTASIASLFLISSYAFYKSHSIVGQVILLGIFMSLYL